MRTAKKTLRKTVVMLLLILGMVSPCLAEDWAKEWTQILNNIQLVQQTKNQIDGLYNDATMIRNQIESLRSVASYKGQWGNIDQILLQIGMIRQQNDAVWNNVQGLYTRTKALYPQGDNSNSYGQAVSMLNGPVLAAADGAVAVMADQSVRLAQEDVLVKNLLQKSEEAVGQTQALQTMNQLMAQLIAQMQELRVLNEWQLAQKSAEAKKQAELENKEHKDLQEVFHLKEAVTSRPISEQDLFEAPVKERSSYRLSKDFEL